MRVKPHTLPDWCGIIGQHSVRGLDSDSWHAVRALLLFHRLFYFLGFVGIFS
jgi:hypothetical protein